MKNLTTLDLAVLDLVAGGCTRVPVSGGSAAGGAFNLISKIAGDVGLAGGFAAVAEHARPVLDHVAASFDLSDLDKAWADADCHDTSDTASDHTASDHATPAEQPPFVCGTMPIAGADVAEAAVPFVESNATIAVAEAVQSTLAEQGGWDFAHSAERREEATSPDAAPEIRDHR